VGASSEIENSQYHCHNFKAHTAVNTAVTNVPNPQGGHYFTGAKVLSYAGFGPINDYLGLFHTITGMDFEVTISVTSCRDTLPDILFFMQCLRDSFAELQDAAKQASHAAPATARSYCTRVSLDRGRTAEGLPEALKSDMCVGLGSLKPPKRKINPAPAGTTSYVD
jgi:WS/DGAT C-terminal domain